MSEPAWLSVARTYIGLAEVPGKSHNPTIIRWLTQLRAWWLEDETPWCATFVAACLRETQYELPGAWYRAKAYATWGEPCSPVLGAVAVYERAGGGHVGFAVGYDGAGRLLTLGGNQGNRVCIAPFTVDRLIACRWPAGAGHVTRYPLMVAAVDGPASSDEA